MRVSSTQYHGIMNQALQNGNSETSKLMQKMASGQKLLLPSDDPMSSVRLLRLEREDAALTQYQESIVTLKNRLSNNESIMGSMSKDMLEIRDMLVLAANTGANTATDLNAMAGPLLALRDSLYFAANTRNQEGSYMFSGTLTTTETITLDATQPAGSRYTFTGNTELQKVVVGNGFTQPANETLEDLHLMLNQLDTTIEMIGATTVNPGDPAVRNNLESSLDALDAAMAALSGKIAAVGNEQNILDTLNANHVNVSLSNQQAMISLGALDYAEASVQLNGYMVALQSTHKAYGKISSLSLFDSL